MTRFRNTLHQEGQSQNQRIWKSKDLKDVRKKKPTCLNMISPPTPKKKTKKQKQKQKSKNMIMTWIFNIIFPGHFYVQRFEIRGGCSFC